MLENITERIKTLPPLLKSFHEINSMCGNENGTMNEPFTERNATMTLDLVEKF